MKRCQSTKRVLPKESPIVTRVLLRLPLGKSKNIAAKETHNRSRIEELDKRSGTSNEDQNHSRNEGEKGGDRPRIVAPRLYSRSPSPPPEWKSKPRDKREREPRKEAVEESREIPRKSVNPVVEEHLAARSSLIDEQVNQMKKAMEDTQKEAVEESREIPRKS